VLRPWNATFLDLERQVDELFEELIYRPWAIPARPGWRPPLDLHETADAYLVEVDLPGVPPEEVRVLVSERNLTITGRRQPAPLEGVLCEQCERPCGTFHRACNLPQAVDSEQARAECRHGTYRIYLPKKRQPEGPAKRSTLRMEGTHDVIRVSVT
jgi:HSP20 family protein